MELRRLLKCSTTISLGQSFDEARFVGGMYDAGVASSRERYVGSFGGEPFRGNEDVTAVHPCALRVARCNDVAVAPFRNSAGIRMLSLVWSSPSDAMAEIVNTCPIDKSKSHYRSRQCVPCSPGEASISRE